MKITFWGAAKTVTGSCHLLEHGSLRFLLDCGLFQGHDEARNRQDFPFDPEGIDFVVLSHAHLDHCGMIPRLVREGFRGQVISTPPTAAIAKHILLDAAHLQEEEAERHARRAARRGEPPPAPLFDVGDVLEALDHFSLRPSYGEWVSLGEGVRIRFHDAGHVLGSAMVEVSWDGGSLVFSGDLGSRGRPIVRDPEPAPKADYLLCEGTYGDRPHKSFQESFVEFRDAVREVLQGGGNVLIPSFALERTQEVLYVLFLLWQEGDLPKQTEIVLDSPLASATTRVFRRYADWFDEEGRKLFREPVNPFSFPALRIVRSVEESKALNHAGGGHVIIAGSGMCTGGRIVHHLRHQIWKEENGIIFVGYQARGTLGREIVEGAKKVRILGEEVAVRARIWTINGFSAHADREELLGWISAASPSKGLFLVHGEERALESLAEGLRAKGLSPVIPDPGDSVAL